MNNTTNMNKNDFSSEYVNDFAIRVTDMIKSECELLDFLYNHPLCLRDVFSSANEEMLYDEIKLKHDNDFCRVRELLRELKKDPNLLIC